ncbi:MAG: DUF3667 domain-containing protein [Luteimonas sp.]
MSSTGNDNGLEDPSDSKRAAIGHVDVAVAVDPVQQACENCGATLLGEHCYACGQPVKGLVRHFSSIFGDFFDTVFNIDWRVFRTLWPLFAKPGFLSHEYFAGRRVRYVSPVRLFFFLTIITFFIAQLTVSFGDDSIRFGNGGGNDDIGGANTIPEVERARDAALARMIDARKGAGQAPGAVAGIRIGEEAIRDAAQSRIEALRDAAAAGKPPPQADDDGLSFGNGRWDAEKNPIKIDALPAFANAWLNTQAGRANRNIGRIKEDPELFKEALLSAVPTALFVLLPVFALMLKILYLFKQRLYMEHLIVALHSHAFLSLMLLLTFLTLALQRWLAPGGGTLHSALGWLEFAIWAWATLYLLLMQKRIYGQGWPMTLLKFFVLGVCYAILLSFGAAATVLSSLVWM